MILGKGPEQVGFRLRFVVLVALEDSMGMGFKTGAAGAGAEASG